jgi:hypothetical protein
MTCAARSVLFTFAALGFAGAVPVRLVPLPRAHAHVSVSLDVRGQASPHVPAATQRLLFLADTGHDVNLSASAFCAQVEEVFDAGAFAGARCRETARGAVRAARGVAVQHAPSLSAAVVAMESFLGEEGYAARDWAGMDGAWSRPYRARFLADLVARVLDAPPPAAPAGGGAAPFAPARVRNVCSVGFGTGHTALALLTAGVSSEGGAAIANSRVRVFSFDRATGRAAVPANDYLDARFPDRNFLFLGDPPAAMGRFRAAFPDTRCDVALVEPNALQPLAGGATTAALRALAPLAAPGHVLVLVGGAGAGAGDADAPARAWRDAAEGGELDWEGTVLESPDAPDGEAIRYGAFSTALLGAGR